MENITIGGAYHDKVYGADTPGPIWKDAMSGALNGKPAPNFVTVPIKDPNARKPSPPKKPGREKPGREKPGNGGRDNPWPDISLPPGVIGGNGNGGNGNGGNGNGGFEWPR